ACDAPAARATCWDESGGGCRHVSAGGGRGTSGEIAKAVGVGADAVMLGTALARATEAPGRGMHWCAEAHHPQLPRVHRAELGTVGSLEQVLFGPGRTAIGELNLVGALRRALATTGYLDLKEFQRVDVTVSPYQSGSVV